MNTVDMEKARKEELRWLILMALNAARPIGTTETIIRRAVESEIPDLTDHEIRCELDYLKERDLIELDTKRPAWFAKLNRYGIDVVEYTVDCHPGIARPAKW